MRNEELAGLDDTGDDVGVHDVLHVPVDEKRRGGEGGSGRSENGKREELKRFRGGNVVKGGREEVGGGREWYKGT